MTNRFILRGAAVALALSAGVLVAGGAAYFRIARARTASLRAWSDARCTAFRAANPGAADPCVVGPVARPLALPVFRAGEADVAAARAALARGSDGEAAARIAAALDRVQVLDRHGTMIGTLTASKLASEALDVLDESPGLSQTSEVRAALARTTLVSARRPLEAERLGQLRTALASAPPGAFVTWGASDARVAEEAERGDAVLHAMESAARRGDLGACQRAARQDGGLFGADFRAVLCPKLVDVARTERRLVRARSR